MELDVRGVQPWEIREYLTRLGGLAVDEDSFAGSGWRATLTLGEHRAFGSILPRVIIRFEGESLAVKAVYDALRLRVMRSGG